MAGSARSRGSLELRAGQERLSREIYLPVHEFIRTEGVASGALLVAAVVALVLANTPLRDVVHRLWDAPIALDLLVVDINLSLRHWVNDGLMAVFFFVVGLEIKREVLHGQLADRRKAALPAAAALGGMVVPALLYAALNLGGEGARGWGVPMATDIAFALGVLGLLGKRIPAGLRVLLLGLAVVDDLGAVLVIALFYTESISAGAIGAAAMLLAAILVTRRIGVRSVAVYGLLGFLFWVAVLDSGVHATLAGVILGLLTPSRHTYDDDTALVLGRKLLDRFGKAVARDDHDDAEATLGQLEELVVGTESPLERLERTVHPWTAFLILPLFALANAGVALSADALGAAARSPVAAGIVVGLVAGKLAGVLGVSWLAVKSGVASLPDGVRWVQMAGVSLIAGIGFTMSLFVAGLAFAEAAMVDAAKAGILFGSAAAAVAGYLVLRLGARAAAGRAAAGSAA